MYRVLHILRSNGMGGAERCLADVARYWSPERVQCELAYMKPDGAELEEELQRLGWTIHHLPVRNWATWAARVRRISVDREIDLVHAHSPLPASIARLVLPRTVPFIYSEQAAWDNYRTLTRWANRLTFNRNDIAVAVSDKVRESIRPPAFPRWGAPPSMRTVPNGVDLRRFSPPGRELSSDLVEKLVAPKRPIVGSIAHLKRVKGHEYLLQAAVEVRQAVPDVHFVFVGSGPERVSIERRIAELDLADCVSLLGARPDVAALLTTFDVFVLASRTEGMPLALLEAMAAGRAIVATSVGGVGEVVRHEEHGVLVPPSDGPALGRSIIRLLRDHDLREKLGAAAEIRVKAFDAQSVATDLERIYADAMGRDSDA